MAAIGFDDVITIGPSTEGDEKPLEQAAPEQGKDVKTSTVEASEAPQEPPAPLIIQSWANVMQDQPKRSPVLIGSESDGVLRVGHIMELTGASKAGKSMFALMLACSIATGSECIGIPCARGRVLYLNFEIQGASFYGRISRVWSRLAERGADQSGAINLDVLNLRGNPILEAGLPKLSEYVVEAIATKAAQEGAEDARGYYSAIFFDPFYMCFNGDENSAGDVKNAIRQFIALAEVTGASVIYVHHHAKGASGGKDSIDRGAGSGVHGRAPDAIVDIIDLPDSESIAERIHEQFSPIATPLRVRFNLREFKPKKPIEVIYNYPSYELAPADLGLEFCADKGRNAGAEKKQEQTDKKWRQLNEAIAGFMERLPEGEIIEAKQLYEELDGLIPECSENTFKGYLRDNRCDYKVCKEHIDGLLRWPVRLRREPLELSL